MSWNFGVVGLCIFGRSLGSIMSIWLMVVSVVFVG